MMEIIMDCHLEIRKMLTVVVGGGSGGGVVDEWKWCVENKVVLKEAMT